MTIAILLAAGRGKRLNAKTPKAFVNLAGAPLLVSALQTLTQHKDIAKIIIVTPQEKIPMLKKILGKQEKNITIIAGGATRLTSLTMGLKKIHTNNPHQIFVLVHNAANPFITTKEISAVLTAAKKSGAATVGRIATATVKEIKNDKINHTLDRQKIWLAETPQVVRLDLLQKGLAISRTKKIIPTDDVQLAELAGVKPDIVSASEQNRKITTLNDLNWARNKFLNPQLVALNPVYRIGLGQDSHPFSSEKKPLVLAGTRIASMNGLAGNSDGDVILHALINALSSALGGGSISNYADALCSQGVRDSRVYLREVLKKLVVKKIQIINVSITCEAARPKLEKMFSHFKKNLARLLNTHSKNIGITVTSGEKLTAFGRGKGIQCFAIVLLQLNTSSK